MAIVLRLEDRLDGAGHFVPWKARIVLILEENELWDEVVHSTQANSVIVPTSTNPQALSSFNKDIKSRRIILNAVKDVSFIYITDCTTSMKHSVKHLTLHLTELLMNQLHHMHLMNWNQIETEMKAQINQVDTTVSS